MKQLIQKKPLLLLITLVLGVGLLCTLYGAFRFTTVFRYPNTSFVKDVSIEIDDYFPYPHGFCLRASSLMVTKDQVADVRNWYYQQGWQASSFPIGALERQPLRPLYLGSVEVRFLSSRVDIVRWLDDESTQIYQDNIFCVGW
jgi:hypothetical protein